MLQVIVVCLMIQVIMEATVLAVSHRIPMRLPVIQVAVVTPVLQVVVMPGVVRMGTRIIRMAARAVMVKLSLGGRSDQGRTEKPRTSD